MNSRKNFERLQPARTRRAVVDTDAEHNQVLLALGQLDDIDDYLLYLEQERRFDAMTAGIDAQTWRRYVLLPS